MEDHIVKEHWENVYNTKKAEEVSWTQVVPKTSLTFISSLCLAKDAAIIDVGGGDSNLVDHLLNLGFENVTVLDISGKALERAQLRLGDRAKMVKWIESDITTFEPEAMYDLWHDRAAFHFLTAEQQLSAYLDIVQRSVTGHMIIGTFSENGPLKCSGLEIKRYTEDTLRDIFHGHFDRRSCLRENHVTPFGTEQNFVFCSFKKI
ncbi:class I SAM-dependent methyltransferase [Sphingobacterium yanglingense]|uniref:Methyltransferase family protein n=1 Tax=Sphingobacterium yanglingense TaxID=1437280 RepID=A0A4R6WN24_9SPHI|nr:class I SAM-dependent methyltransferase [Sphingobacterium yanglingense]TDQ80192.1 methyltransferase family protein [Sphingobacterium yanglingense]